MNLTYAEFKSMLPKKQQKNITEKIFNKMVDISKDDDASRFYRENLVTYMSVIQDGKYKIESYLAATKYVTYKMMGDTNKLAYRKTFPERYQKMIDSGKAEKDISSQITAYNKTQLVTSIYERSMIPISIMYKDLFHNSIIQEAELARNASSDTVRQKALAHLIDTLKPPEETKIELDVSIGNKDESIVDQYEKALYMAAEKMQGMMHGGSDIKSVANIKLSKEEEIIDVEED